MKLAKQAYTFPAQLSSPDLCYSCEDFDPSKCREAAEAKGYCDARKMILYRTDFAFCLDYNKKKELKEE